MGKSKKQRKQAKKNSNQNNKQQKLTNNNVNKAVNNSNMNEKVKPALPEKEEKPERKIEKSEIENVNSFKEKLKTMNRAKTVYLALVSALSAFFVVLVILLLCGVFATDELKSATVVYYGRNESEKVISVISSDEATQKDYVKGTKASGYTGRFGFYAQTEINMNETDSLAPLSISNPTYNECTIIVTITDGNGKVLYRSLGIKPGQYINSISFNNGLNYGVNNLKMYVTAFEGDGGKDGRSFKKIGNQFVDLKVNVGTEYNSSMFEEIRPNSSENVTVSESATAKK